MFDKCFAELSPAAQHDLQNRLYYLSTAMDKGGVISAKELIVQFARFVEVMSGSYDPAE